MFLQSIRTAPRPQALAAAFNGNVDLARLTAFLDRVWSQLQLDLAQPIQVTETEHWRYIVVLGCVRFALHRESGLIDVQEMIATESRYQFATSTTPIVVDLPLRLDGFWLDPYLARHRGELAACLIDSQCPGSGSWHDTVKRELQRAVRLSTHWRRLRHAIRDTLGLDRELVLALHIGRGVSYLTNKDYNNALRYRSHYRRVQAENPHLLWLLNTAREHGLKLRADEDAIAAIKARMWQGGIRNAGWRYLVRCKVHHFQHINQLPVERRWQALLGMLHIAQDLRSSQPLDPQVIAVLDIDSTADGLRMRDIPVPANVVRSAVREAVRQKSEGQLSVFQDSELVDVLMWLKGAEVELDSNQQRQGWTYLSRRAVEWKADQEAQCLREESWTSLLPEISVDGYQVIPLVNVYDLWREGIAMRHCIANENYVKGCRQGSLRVFSLQRDGRRIATLSIELESGTWQFASILGFANAKLGATMGLLGHAVADRYADMALLAGDTLDLNEEDSDEERADNDCPICNASFGECSHAVAIYDLTFGELEGGDLYDAYGDIHHAVEQVIRVAAMTGEWMFNVSESIRQVPDEIPADATDDAVDEVLCNHSGDIREMIFDRLNDYGAAVITSEWIFDANRPGGCSAYRGWWAEDPEAVVEWLRGEFSLLRPGSQQSVVGSATQNSLQHHPRIQALRALVNQLPVDAMYRAALHRSLGRYADQVVSRPHFRPEDGWDDLEALQQVTLGDMMEEKLVRRCR